MSLTWQEWEADLLERERAFEHPRARVVEPVAPWGLWDYGIAAFIVVVILGFLVVALGDFSA